MESFAIAEQLKTLPHPPQTNGAAPVGQGQARATLLARFAAREAHVAVIGLGYVGLPLAVAFAEAGYQVTGIDLDPREVDAINRGESYIEDVPSAVIAALVGQASTQNRSDAADKPSPNHPITLSPVTLSLHDRILRIRLIPLRH